MDGFGVPPGKLWIGQLKPKREGIISNYDYDLSKGHRMGRSWEAGETVNHTVPGGSHIRNLTYTCYLEGCYLGHVLAGGASVCSRALQAP